jgi:short-subunit dehydrogenase
MRVALITGAANGLGLALSTICLTKDFIVVLVDKDNAKLRDEAKSLTELFPNQVHSIVCDITNTNDVKQLALKVQHLGLSVDWLFNNAGIIGSIGPLWTLDINTVYQVMEVNVYGMVHMIQEFMPLLIEQANPAHIINMASLYAVCSGSQLAPYSMSKHAVLALSESLYFDLQRLNKAIEVSVVLPSFTNTDLLKPTSPSQETNFHHSLNTLLSHSRPPLEVASQIIAQVEQKKFYIFPDKEVKSYSEERNQSMIAQTPPHLNSIEKLMRSLSKRST